MDVQNGCPKVQKKSSKKSSKNNYTKITNCWREGRGGEGWGGWRIVIPMPEAINFVDGRRQKHSIVFWTF
jgi:hypothetical protein